MSFLLDALKKSEQERQGLLPDLQTQHTTQATKQWSWHWLALFGFIILMNIALFFWFSQSNTASTAKPTVEVVTVVHKTPPPVAEAKRTPLPLSDLQDTPMQITESIQVTTHTVTLSNIVHAKPMQQSENKPLTLRQLSPQQRKNIGHVDISAHFFNDQKKDRIVMINGETKYEGQWVHPELQIKAITAQGVLLQYHDLVFSMEAFQELKP